MKDILVLLATMGGGLGCFLLGMKHLSEGLQSVLRIGGDDSAPLVALATLDVFNALDRARSCLINIAETLAGGKRTASD